MRTWPSRGRAAAAAPLPAAPAEALAAAPASEPADQAAALPAVITVAALSDLIGERIEGLAAGIWIRGEAASVKLYRGTCYLELKDEAAPGAARLQGVIWAGALARSSAPPPAVGDKLEVRGRVSFYKARGEAQIVIQSWRRAGLGELYEQFLKLKAKLQSEGLFDAARKKPLPRFVKRAAVVTSGQAAALQDVLRTVRRRTPWIELILVEAPVQGAEAPARIARALAQADALGADAVLLVRGGGSYEDLQAFNSELVARAIARMATPVITGVGHESDETIADYAADLRASTPTAAAEHLSPDLAYWLSRLEAASSKVFGAAARTAAELHQRLDRAAMLIPEKDRLLEPQRSALALAERTLEREWRAAEEAKALRLAAAARIVRSPEERLTALARRTDDAAARAFAGASASAAVAEARLRLAALQLPKPEDFAARLNERLELAAAKMPAPSQLFGRLEDKLGRLAAELEAFNPDRPLAAGYVRVLAAGEPVTAAASLAVGDELSLRFADGSASVRVERIELSAAADPASK